MLVEDAIGDLLLSVPLELEYLEDWERKADGRSESVPFVDIVFKYLELDQTQGACDAG